MSVAVELPSVVLKPRRALPFFSGHPWVFAGAIARIDGDPEPGAEVALRTLEGEFIARGLEQRRHKVTMAQDGSEALDNLKKAKFDLLLTDIDMPIMDGIALALAAGRDYRKMKIIIMSGHEHQIERALTSSIEKKKKGEQLAS